MYHLLTSYPLCTTQTKSFLILLYPPSPKVMSCLIVSSSLPSSQKIWPSSGKPTGLIPSGGSPGRGTPVSSSVRNLRIPPLGLAPGTILSAYAVYPRFLKHVLSFRKLRCQPSDENTQLDLATALHSGHILMHSLFNRSRNSVPITRPFFIPICQFISSTVSTQSQDDAGICFGVS